MAGAVPIATFSLLSNLNYLPKFFFSRTSQMIFYFQFYGEEKLGEPLPELFYSSNFQLLSQRNLLGGGGARATRLQLVKAVISTGGKDTVITESVLLIIESTVFLPTVAGPKHQAVLESIVRVEVGWAHGSVRLC